MSILLSWILFVYQFDRHSVFHSEVPPLLPSARVTFCCNETKFIRCPLRAHLAAHLPTIYQTPPYRSKNNWKPSRISAKRGPLENRWDFPCQRLQHSVENPIGATTAWPKNPERASWRGSNVLTVNTKQTSLLISPNTWRKHMEALLQEDYLSPLMMQNLLHSYPKLTVSYVALDLAPSLRWTTTLEMIMN